MANKIIPEEDIYNFLSFYTSYSSSHLKGYKHDGKNPYTATNVDVSIDYGVRDKDFIPTLKKGINKEITPLDLSEWLLLSIFILGKEVTLYESGYIDEFDKKKAKQIIKYFKDYDLSRLTNKKIDYEVEVKGLIKGIEEIEREG